MNVQIAKTYVNDYMPQLKRCDRLTDSERNGSYLESASLRTLKANNNINNVIFDRIQFNYCAEQ